jgi:hypothetical protein
MKKQVEVPKGKDTIAMSVSGHTYVRLLDPRGEEIYRSASATTDVTAVVGPGAYTIETDGKIGKSEAGSLQSLDPTFRSRVAADATKPPKL